MSSFELSRPLPGVRSSAVVSAWAGALCLSAVVIAYAVWTALLLPTNVDVSWLLIVCDRLLGGERLTTDILEINPPFSIWLYMPFMLMERLTGIRAELWLMIGVIAAGVLSVAASAAMLARADGAYRHRRAIWAIPFVLFVVLCLFPMEFGQREHFATIALLPWLALQVARQHTADFSSRTRWEPVLAGICAAVVVMVKPPHFALAIMLPSLCLALSRKSPKPLFVTENLLGAAIVLAYAIYIVLFQQTFLNDVLPFVGEIYLPLRQPLLELLLNWPEIVLLLAAVAAVSAGGVGKLDWDVRIPLLAAIGFIPAFVVMGKGWPNHAMPMLVAATVGFILQLVRMDFGRVPPTRTAMAALGCLIVLFNAGRIQQASLSLDSQPMQRAAAAITQVVAKPTIVSLAARLQPAHPLSRLVGGRFVSRYASAWAAYNADELARAATDPAQRDKLAALRDGVVSQLAREIADKKPDIVLYSNETGPRWDELMLDDSRIAGALRDYSLLSRDPSVTVYLRSDLSKSARGAAGLGFRTALAGH